VKESNDINPKNTLKRFNKTDEELVSNIIDMPIISAYDTDNTKFKGMCSFDGECIEHNCINCIFNKL